MSEARPVDSRKKDIQDLAAEERRVIEGGDVDEIAEFYDRTDTADLHWEETDSTVVERPELEQISIRLPKEDLDALRRRAAKSGVGYTTLIRMIVRAHLDNPLTY